MNNRLLVSTRHDGLVVPASVIQRGPNGTYAYVITKDKTAEMRPVQVAQIDGGQALIDSGLQEGEQVVVDGQYKLQPGSPVQITTPNSPVKGKELTQANETPAPDQAAADQAISGRKRAGASSASPAEDRAAGRQRSTSHGHQGVA